MEENGVFGFSWRFLDEMTLWALGLAGAVALVGGLVMHDAPFAAGCVIAAVIDVSLVRVASQRGRKELVAGRFDSVAPMIMLAGRLLEKMALLVAALEFPRVLGFAGTVIGALSFDVTLSFVGSIVAARRTMGGPKEGR